jgi:hypothetical protein
MTEAVENKPVEEVIEIAEAAQPEKPYTFRLLGAPDIFLMVKIIKKIGIKEFKACVESDSIISMIQNAAKENAENEDANIASVGVGVVLEVVDVILGNLPSAEKEIYQLLSQISNLSVDEITAPGNAVMFVEMVIDFFKKDEFRDFYRVVSGLLN